MKIETWLAVLGFLGGILTTLTFQLWHVIRWYSDSKLKEYAAKRDFEHLRNNQEQLKENLKVILDELEESRENQLQMKNVFQMMLLRQGDSISGILGYKKPERGKGEIPE